MITWFHVLVNVKKNKVTRLWEGPSVLHDAAGGNKNIGENSCKLPPLAAVACLMEMLGNLPLLAFREEQKMKWDFQPV